MREYLTNLQRWKKRVIALAFDTSCVWLSLALAFIIRFGDSRWLYDEHYFNLGIAVAAPLTALPFFIRLGLYRAVLRYITSVALLTIIKAVILATISLVLIDVVLLTDSQLPRSIPFLYGLILSILMIGSRYIMQRWLLGVGFRSIMKELVRNRTSLESIGKPVLIYGQGSEVTELVNVLDGTREYQPQVIIDADGLSAGGEIKGRPLYNPDSLELAIDQFKPEEILLAMPNASRHERMQTINSLERFGLSIRTMPNWEDLLSGRFKLQDIQEVDIADVLGRKEIEPKPALMSKCISNKVVMVTGAGGSIGSEICRQIIKLEPKCLILLDHAEFNLYAIDGELRTALEKQNLAINLVSLLTSVTEQDRMFTAMQRYKVDTVFHAAAYKHVPIVEHNIIAGIKNNVWGTVFTAQAAISAGVSDFVLISTDKAVRPTNIMGASKRMAEMALQAIQAEEIFEPYLFEEKSVLPKSVNNTTCFSMVRFGNVLGSSGSVIPLFREQIRLGGPVTITHPDINRYFMSIPEAAQLVIQAGAMSTGGDVFVLDMGEPVQIEDLAKRMVQLSGLSIKNNENPEGDIELIYTGLRPGEKLYEELLIADDPQETEHPRICKANEHMLTWQELIEKFKIIESHAQTHNFKEIRECLESCVKGFKPNSTIVDWLSD